MPTFEVALGDLTVGAGSRAGLPVVIGVDRRTTRSVARWVDEGW